MIWFTSVQAQLLSCDSEYVTAKRQTVEVQPNGIDDTGNIQCALDSAVAYGYPTVLLTAGNFNFSSVGVQKFNARLVGAGAAETVLTVLDASIDCEAMRLAGQLPAAIKFAKGEPRIKSMTILSGAACVDGAGLQAVIHLTGLPDSGKDCNSDVVYGLVDRLVINNPGRSTVSAVHVSPEGGCKDNLQGSFKLNRSEVSGFDTAVVTAMRASAQVDINFNRFSQNRVDVMIPNANQSTTITRNTFTGIAEGGSYVGVKVLTDDIEAPDSNRVVIHKNTFEIEATGVDTGAAIVYSQTAKIANLSTIASENTFNLNGAGSYGIVGGGVSGSIVNNNRFTGSADAGILASPPESPASSDWSIMANTGFRMLESSGSDIILGPELSNSVVGAQQAAEVIDHGKGNSVLPMKTDEDLLDRVAALETLVASLSARLDGHTGDAVLHHGRYTDTEAVAAAGPHFSGDHADLVNVTAGQHHEAYSDTQAVAAVGPHFSGDHDDLKNVTRDQHHADVLLGVTRDIDPNTGEDTLKFSNMNLQIVNGSGTTGGVSTGTGNLIIGYNELRGENDDRGGSHMLVIGRENNYQAGAFGGMVVGRNNEVTAPHTSVSGGFSNTASALYASVSGGADNNASGFQASVNGGQKNVASGNYSTVNGGTFNSAAGNGATVGGGTFSSADGSGATVSGGTFSTASGVGSSVSGGLLNSATGVESSVSGGEGNIASAKWSVISGGKANSTSGQYASVSGGSSNTAIGKAASISGGSDSIASGRYSSIGGGQNNTASGEFSSVSGGDSNLAGDLFSSVSGGKSNTAGAAWSSANGGSSNQALGELSSINGGFGNMVTGDGSTISGGIFKSAASRECIVGDNGVDC